MAEIYDLCSKLLPCFDTKYVIIFREYAVNIYELIKVVFDLTAKAFGSKAA